MHNFDEVYGQSKQKMEAAGLPAAIVTQFGTYLKSVTEHENCYIAEKDIDPVSDKSIISYATLPNSTNRTAQGKTVIIKLNGGLGTTMGLDRAKALLPVKNGKSFLDLTLHQKRSLDSETNTSVPFILMNSFYTHTDTLAALGTNSNLARSLMQHKYPRLTAQTFTPVEYRNNSCLEWNPPGHGDLPSVLFITGALDELIDAGVEYAFISNIDNLGARFNPKILDYCLSTNQDILMEVATRTPDDSKGGHLAQSKRGSLLLRESAMCAPEDKPFFMDISRHRFFNTNNIWIRLKALRDILLPMGGTVDLPVIQSMKQIDPVNADSGSALQLETAMGTLISLMQRNAAMLVPRTRFSPVKSISQLLSLWSDAYKLDSQGYVLPANASSPAVSLDSRYFGSMHELMRRFPHGAPSLLNCQRLTVQGNIIFGRNITCVDQVTIESAGSLPVTIPDNSTLTGHVTF